MFTDGERDELVSRIHLLLEQGKVGRSDVRRATAEQIVDEARIYLKGRYATRPDAKDKPKTGFHFGTDVLRPDDTAKGK
ncbi:MAG: hypothetical protein MN733_40805 [Nitrososphaera sp.]|nr:hypothetical protein [Nitrososphaera sp.]